MGNKGGLDWVKTICSVMIIHFKTPVLSGKIQFSRKLNLSISLGQKIFLDISAGWKFVYVVSRPGRNSFCTTFVVRIFRYCSEKRKCKKILPGIYLNFCLSSKKSRINILVLKLYFHLHINCSVRAEIHKKTLLSQPSYPKKLFRLGRVTSKFSYSIPLRPCYKPL